MSKNSIQLYSKFQCENTFKELNSLIKVTSSFVEKKDNEYSSSERRFEDSVDLIYSHLFEKTDLSNRLFNINATKRSINIWKILYELKEFKEEEQLTQILSLLDKEIRNIKKKESKNHRIVFLLNIKQLNRRSNLEIREKEFDTYNDILKVFDIKNVEYQHFMSSCQNMKEKELQKIKQILKYFHSANGEIIEIKIKGRDQGYVFENSIKSLEILFGFLSYVKLSFFRTYRYGENISVDNLDYIYYFILDDNEMLIPHNLHYAKYEINRKKPRNMLDLKIANQIDKFNVYVDFANEDKSKSKMWGYLEEFFRLYHKACYENNIDYSFLRFWMVSERIIKVINGKSKDEKLINTMSKILNTFYKWPVEKFIERRIEFLYNKRNALVHEGNSKIITEEDRNLAKLISDCVLWFYIDNYPKLNNIEEYNFYLQNFKQSPDNIKRYSDILKTISKERKYSDFYNVIQKWSE